MSADRPRTSVLVAGPGILPMVTFDAPIVACEVCGEYVVRDQSVAACAREHDCGDRICPMRDCFPVDVEPADVEKTPK